MYSSHSYPYQTTTSPSSSMPTPPQAQPPPRLHYPHPTYTPPPPASHPRPAYPSPNSATAMPSPVGGAVAGVGRPPLEFPLIEHLSADELNRLMNNDAKLNDIADDRNENKQRQVDKEMAMAENRSLADFNLSRETRLREGRLQLARLHEDSKRIRETYDEDRRKLEAVNENFSLDAARVMVETAASKTEDESEEIAELFLDGSLPLTDFVEQFAQRRTLAHVRRIKSDKMRELMKNPPARPASTPQPYANVNIPMSTPLGHTPSPLPSRPAPALPARPASQAPPYQPGYPTHAAMPYQAPSGGSTWTPTPGAVRMPSLPSYPR